MNLIAYLEGKKTYLVAVLTALDGLFQYYVQHDTDWKALVNYLLVGGGLAALRRAIAKTE
jgi:hypothetical protein